MVDDSSCILDFPKFSGGGPRTPHIKWIHQLNPQNLSSTTTTAKGKKKKKKKNRAEKPSPIKTIYKKFIFRLYRNWKKEEGAGSRSFLCDLFIGLFETLFCAIAEDNVCDNCIVSSWALLYFLLCLWWWWPNLNFLCCVITQNGESGHDLLFPPPPKKKPVKTLITLLPITSFLKLDPQLGVDKG